MFAAQSPSTKIFITFVCFVIYVLLKLTHINFEVCPQCGNNNTTNCTSPGNIQRNDIGTQTEPYFRVDSSSKSDEYSTSDVKKPFSPVYSNPSDDDVLSSGIDEMANHPNSPLPLVWSWNPGRRNSSPSTDTESVEFVPSKVKEIGTIQMYELDSMDGESEDGISETDEITDVHSMAAKADSYIHSMTVPYKYTGTVQNLTINSGYSDGDVVRNVNGVDTPLTIHTTNLSETTDEEDEDSDVKNATVSYSPKYILDVSKIRLIEQQFGE
eukprot:273964_1